MRIILLAAIALWCSVAYARPPIDPDVFEDGKERMAQALMGEADGTAEDHKAIVWVLAKRWKLRQHRRALHAKRYPDSTRFGEPFPEFIKLYSAPLRVDSERARAVQALRWGQDPSRGFYGRHARRWDRIQRLVEKFGAGKLRDPCPSALHWGGTTDTARPGWIIVQCGATRNTFYKPGVSDRV
jgi:hypothetical protein